jgi:hypothetical protein
VSRSARGAVLVSFAAVRSRTSPIAAAIAAVLAVVALGGCGSGGAGVQPPKIGAARTFGLASFQPSGAVRPGVATRVSFVIRQPSGKPLTAFKTGAGPHTGVHLIIVRDDLATIVHRHPPIAADGTISEPLTLPAPGRYRVLVDVYPKQGPNFQLFGSLRAAGAYRPLPLPPFRAVVSVGGDRFVMHGSPRLKAIDPVLLTMTVTDSHGRPVRFTPWYGALAHAIFFRAGTLDYFHTHVCGAGAANCTSALGATKITGHSTTPGKLTVGVLLPVPGTWRLFLQCQVDGKVVTAPFTLQARG